MIYIYIYHTVLFLYIFQASIQIFPLTYSSHFFIETPLLKYVCPLRYFPRGHNCIGDFMNSCLRSNYSFRSRMRGVCDNKFSSSYFVASSFAREIYIRGRDATHRSRPSFIDIRRKIGCSECRLALTSCLHFT